MGRLFPWNIMHHWDRLSRGVRHRTECLRCLAINRTTTSSTNDATFSYDLSKFVACLVNVNRRARRGLEIQDVSSCFWNGEMFFRSTDKAWNISTINTTTYRSITSDIKGVDYKILFTIVSFWKTRFNLSLRGKHLDVLSANEISLLIWISPANERWYMNK